MGLGFVKPALALGLWLGAGNAWSEPPSRNDRMAWAAAYLHEAMLPNGRFVYRRNAADGSEDRRRYNLLRHAGALYALTDYHLRVAPSPAERENLRRAAAYVIDCCVSPLPGNPDALALWSVPEVVGRPRAPLQAKLGGAGLALVAFATLEGVAPGATGLPLRRRLGEFLLAMQDNDGSFVSKYVPARGGPDPSWVSRYYPGEAALGLVMLYEQDPDPRWLRSAMDALRYLARQRETAEVLPADHWALLATERLLRQPGSALEEASPTGLAWIAEDGSGVRSLLIAHAEALVDSILAEQFWHGSASCPPGGFDSGGRVAPTATRLEGLLAAWAFLQPGTRRAALERAARQGLDFLDKAQLTAPAWRGAYTRVSMRCPSDDPRAMEVRIDYVQHALSAMLMADRLPGT
jgi:hypothetical protein